MGDSMAQGKAGLQKMIPLAIPNIGPLEGEYLQKCVDDNFVSTVGKFVTDLEDGIAQLSGVNQAAAMGAGTQALHLGLLALDIGVNDLVLVPSFTFIASTNAICHAGAQPWFIDIDTTSWTMDPEKLAEAIEAEAVERNGLLYHHATGKRVAAIMPVYTLGTPADMDPINAIAKRYNLPVIADAAAAIGVTYKGQKIGGLCDLTAYSFNGNKTITSGGGGMLVGKDDLVLRAKHLSSTARVSPNYDHDVVGYNYRMTNLEAAVGCAQLTRLDGFLEAKKRIRKTYNDAVADITGVTGFPAPDNRESAYWFSGVVLDEDLEVSVADVCEGLKKDGIEARPFWRPVHLQKPYLGAPAAPLPVTEDLWSRIVTLPCSTSLTEAEQDLVISSLSNILRR